MSGRREPITAGQLLSDVTIPPMPDRSEALPAEELTWAKMKKIEPGLEELRREIAAVSSKGDPRFCANEVWFLMPGEGHGRGFKERLQALAGWEARSPKLRSEAAYDIAYDRLYALLPDCRECSCGP